MNSTEANGSNEGFLLVPIFLSVYVYGAFVIATWNYASVRVPLCPLIFLILFPPLFPLLLLYFVVLSMPATIDRPIVVVNPDVRVATARVVPSRNKV